jgi:FkbM family methyltransferase
MSTVHALKSLVERLLNVRIYRRLPRGVDPFSDLHRVLPGWQPKVMFDVGANIGQTAVKYAKMFPTAHIFSFEPGQTAYAALRCNVQTFPNVRCFNCALGRESGSVVLLHDQDSSMNRIMAVETGKGSTTVERCEWVEQTTLDEFCKMQEIREINYLKVDVEGADLDVLCGGQDMLGKNAIDVIEIEVGIGPDNERHVPLNRVKEWLEARRYFLFGFYEQVPEWKYNRRHLRRVNAVFLSWKLDVR